MGEPRAARSVAAGLTAPPAAPQARHVARFFNTAGPNQVELGQDSGWLVIFDRRPGLSPVGERLATSVERSPAGRQVTVIRA